MIYRENDHCANTSSISNKQKKFIDIALDCCNPENHYEFMDFHHGCVAVKSGKIIALGRNSSRSYSKDGFIYGCSCHAEIDTLRNIWKIYSKNNNSKKIYSICSKITLYVVRHSKININAHSAPCVNCTHKIKEFGIKKIIYCNEKGSFTIIKTENYFTEHYSGCYRRFIDNKIK